MKKAHLLLLAIAIFIFYACPSDNDINEPLNTVEGTWKMQLLELGSVYDFNGDGIAAKDLLSETNCMQNEIYIFNSDGNGVYNSTESLDIELTVDSNTNEATYNIDCISDDSFSEPLTWSQQSSSVTLTIDEEQLIGTISGDTMTFVFDQGYVVEVLDGNNITEVIEPVTLVLSREQ